MNLRLNIDGPHTDDYTREVASGLAECVRVLNHATLSRNGVDYPSTIYSLLGDVHAAVFGLGQLLGQLDALLVAQREGGLLYDSRGLDPGTTVAHARQALAEARTRVSGLAACVGRAHSATSGLGMRDDQPTVRGGPELDDATEAEFRAEKDDCR